MTLTDQPATSDQPHSRIIRSTTIVGGSAAFNVVFRIVQTKAVAVLLGPEGVGLMGLFNAALGLVSTVAGMGLPTSGVRQIAAAAGSGDQHRIARTVTTVRFLALFFGILGALTFFLLRKPIAQMTFGTSEYAPALGWLSLAVLLLAVSSAQSMQIRGMQRIGDLARASVIGIAIGTFAGLPILFAWGAQGIAPYLIMSALTTFAVSWWYARKIPIAKIVLTWQSFSDEARPLLSLGVVFMASGLITLATAYLVKVVITRQLGLEAAGLYEAAIVLANVYVGFVLGAMGADFYPHLSSIAHNQMRSAELVNAQVEIGLLMATPGILLILALGPFLLQLLYSAGFTSAFDILRWQMIGTFLRVISWPVGYIMLAQGQSRWFFWSEVAANLVNVGIAAVSISLWGLPGIGVAFFAMYLFHVGLTTLVARHLIGFRWANGNLRLIGLLLPIFIVGFLASMLLSPPLAAGLGLVLATGMGVYSAKTLHRLLGLATVEPYWHRIKIRMGRRSA